MGPGYWGEQGFTFMWIIPLLFFVVFLFFMRGMFGQSNSTRHGDGSNSTQSESAREILDKRFAKGEVSKDEYKEMKKVLADEKE